MALGRLSAFTKLEKEKPYQGPLGGEPTATPGPGTGGAGGGVLANVERGGGSEAQPQAPSPLMAELKTAGSALAKKGTELAAKAGFEKLIGGNEANQTGQSLSDQVRSGVSPAYFNPSEHMDVADPSQFGNFDVAEPGVTFEMPGSGMTAGQGVANAGTLQALDTGGFASMAGDLATGAAGGLAGAGAGYIPSMIGRLLGNTNPGISALLSGAGAVAAPAAGGAVAGALGVGGAAGAAGASAGGGAAGAAAGAGAGLAAAAPALLFMAPLFAGMIAKGFSDAEVMQAARSLEHRMKFFGAGLPEQLQSIQGGAEEAKGITPGMDPTKAYAAISDLLARQQAFRETGTENILSRGFSTVSGGSGQDVSADFPQGPALYASLSPYLNQIEAGKLRGLDVLGGAGAGLPPAWMSGTTAWNGEWQPTVNSGNNASMDPYQFAQRFAPASFLSKLTSPIPASHEAQVGQGFEGAPVMGQVYDPVGPEYDMNNPYAEHYLPYESKVNSQLYNELMSIKPGNLEKGFGNLFAPYGGWNDAALKAGFGGGGSTMSPTASTPAAPVNAAAPSAGPSGSNNLQGRIGFAGLQGPLNEIRGGDDLTRV
jgi:hypothetical protein